MSNRPHSMLAITLITIFAIPSNLFAGPFGLCKRRTTKCCPCPVVPTAAATSEIATASIPSPPEGGAEFSCQALVFHDSEGGGISTSDYEEGIPASECPAKKSLLLQQARDRMPTGANEMFLMFDPDCGGTFTARSLSSTLSQGCYWQATYTVWCCDRPEPIKVTVEHESCYWAKAGAKGLACFIANRDCDRIRCCRMQVRLVRPTCP